MEIDHKNNIVFVFESYPWNNDNQFDDEEKKELGLKPDDTIVVKETFSGVAILNATFTTNDTLKNSEVATNECIDDHTITFDFFGSDKNEYFGITFRFEKFKWEILDLVDEETLVKKYHGED